MLRAILVVVVVLVAVSVAVSAKFRRSALEPTVVPTLDLLSFPKITSVRIRAVQQNQRMIQGDARGPDSDWSACRQPVQVAAPT
jgi:hypothetical protein